LTIKYEFTKGGNVGFDFLTTNYGVTNANLCYDLSSITFVECTGLVPGSISTFPFKDDTTDTMDSSLGDGTVFDRQDAHDTAFSGFPPVRTMTMYGATINDIDNNPRTGSDTGNSEDSVTITFTKSTPSTSAVIVTWGGHLGIGANSLVGYGIGNGAGAISGSPFHMTMDGVVDSTGKTVISGNKDLSISPKAIQVGAVAFTQTVTDTLTLDATGSSGPSEMEITVTDTLTLESATASGSSEMEITVTETLTLDSATASSSSEIEKTVTATLTLDATARQSAEIEITVTETFDLSGNSATARAAIKVKRSATGTLTLDSATASSSVENVRTVTATLTLQSATARQSTETTVPSASAIIAMTVTGSSGPAQIERTVTATLTLQSATASSSTASKLWT